LAFNNFVLFDRVHRPIIGKRAAVVEEDLLSVREPVCARACPRERHERDQEPMQRRLEVLRHLTSVRLAEESERRRDQQQVGAPPQVIQKAKHGSDDDTYDRNPTSESVVATQFRRRRRATARAYAQKLRRMVRI
jgi:hypothetical protein